MVSVTQGHTRPFAATGCCAPFSNTEIAVSSEANADGARLNAGQRAATVPTTT